MNNRRSFIKTLLAGTGVLASGALTTAVAMVPAIPVGAAILYCDGIHCDMDAWEAWMQQKDVYWSTGEKLTSNLDLGKKQMHWFRRVDYHLLKGVAKTVFSGVIHHHYYTDYTGKGSFLSYKYGKIVEAYNEQS